MAEHEALKLRLAEGRSRGPHVIYAAKRPFVARVLASAGIRLRPYR
jgi:hypothetical protein